MTEEFYFLKQNEDGEFEQYEPYITVSVDTKKDYEFMKQAIEKQKPKKVKIGQSSKVKAFDGEDKVLTYKCYPCPNCGKWIVANENHKYCEWCGQKLDWSGEDDGTAKEN